MCAGEKTTADNERIIGLLGYGSTSVLLASIGFHYSNIDNYRQYLRKKSVAILLLLIVLNFVIYECSTSHCHEYSQITLVAIHFHKMINSSA